jgi:hypothetical protein
MTQKLANRGVRLLPMNNKTCHQGRKVHSPRRVGWIAAALIAVLALLSVATPAQAAWYNSSWLYRKKLTIDYTKVGATLSHFAVLVSLTSDSDLAARARSDGYDILFTSSDGTTKLDHEIEKYISATGELVAWVRIPSLSNSADTDIYMYYGYASATDQQNKTGVWNDNGGTATNYKGVYHLKETSGTTFADSASNANTGTASGFTAGFLTPAYVQHNAVDRGSTNPGTITFNSSSVSGNLIVVSFTLDRTDRTVTSITDDKSNSYTLAIGPTDWDSGAERSYTYYASNITGGGSAITITITLSGATNTYFEIYATEFSGVATASPLDQTSSATGTGTVINSGSKTTTQAAELIYGYSEVANNPATPDSPLVQRSNFNNNFTADRTVTATGSYSVTGTVGSTRWFCHMLTFKAALASTGTTGKIDGGVDLNGSDNYIYTATSSSLNITGNKITLSAWIRPQDTGDAQIILSKPVATGSWNDPWSQYSLYMLGDSSPYTPYFRLTFGGTDVSVSSSETLSADTWYYLAGIYNGSTMKIYVNGVERGSSSQTGNISSYSTPLQIGANSLLGELFKHNIDEVRVSAYASSTSWLTTEYNNQSNPGPGTGAFFKTLGSEETNLEQEGFRFRADDGNEAGATWLAAQDTNIARDKNLNTRLRVVVNALIDPASTQYQLEYKKSTDSTYSKVLTAQPSTSLPVYVAAGTIASGTGTITPALPAGISANDILLLFVESANQAISISNQNGGTWTEAPDSPQGVGASPPTDPSTRLAVFWSRYNGTQGAPTVADSGNHTIGRIVAIRGCIASGDPFDVTAGNTEGTSDTSGSIPGDTTTIANTLVVVAITSHYDTGADGTDAFNNTWSNADLANMTERTDDTRTANNGGGIGVATGEKAAAGAYGATSVTLVNAAYKAMWTGALKPVPVTQESILISASSNIAASGENTTAQLTPPSGKSTSNFTVGRIQDDENPADAVDIANNYYTEMEWSLIATATAQYGDVYQFRVTANGALLDTYSVTPQWTILSSPTAVTFSSFTATEYSGGVLLKWQTGYEVNNLGFHIYREANGELFRVTPELIAGSAFLTGTGTPLTAGRSYVWFDSPLSPQHSALSTIKYYLEDWDLSGKKTMHGPVTPVRSDTPLLKYGNATLLSDLGKRQNQKYDQFWRIQEIRERLLKDRPAERGKRSVPSGLEDRPFGTRGAARKAGLEAVASSEAILKRSDPQATLQAKRSLSHAEGVTLLESRQERDAPQAQRSLRAAQALASQSGIKIGVREQGWYRVTQPDLIAAGLDPAVDPRRLRLFVDGNEQAILVTGEGDGRFDAGDSIEFYGTGQDTLSSDTRIYWLIEGTRPGKRIKTKQSKNGGAVSQSFPYTVEIKERTIFVAAIKNGDMDNFFGAIVSSEGADQILSVTNLDPSAPGDALLEVALQGGTSVSHRVKVFVNDAEIIEMRFDSTAREVMSIALPQSSLLEGENIVSLVAEGGEADVSAVDYIRLTYWHTYTAEQDSLRFSSSAGREVVINGFTSSSIRVADITNPRQVQEVTGGLVEPDGLNYTLRFRMRGSGKRTLLAFTEAAIKSPATIEANQPSTWHKANHRGDLVIIAHPDFIGSLGPFKSLRESQGWSVALIDVQDLYDEFSFGAKSPQALKDFLHRARLHWQTPPRFVLLVGDASIDPRNYLGLGDFDFVPTKLIDTDYLETASDDWFVDFDNNGLPSLAVGRIPVRTAEEAAVVVSKIVAYENAEPGTWARQAAMIADKMEEGDSFDFEWASLEVETLLPGNVTVQQISRNQGDDGTTRALIIDAINEGMLLVNYIGHGSVEIWRGGIFGSDDVPTLTNGARLPFFITMTCLNGYFHDAFPTESLAESLLKAEAGGAIAVWASSGLTEPEGQSLMNKKLIPLLFDGKSRTLGEATAKAKAATKDMDVRRTWILFGDPTTKLKF